MIRGGAVNKVGLTNPGIDYWCEKIAPKIDFSKGNIVVSIFGTGDELVIMAKKLERFNLAATEVNDSCPNSGNKLSQSETVINSVKEVKKCSSHPITIKVSVTQDYLGIAKGLVGVAEAVSLNSVPWEKVFGPDKKNPIQKLVKKVSGGGGGVSGKPAQKLNWKAVKELSTQGALPVIAPSVMEFDDMEKVRNLGASAVSFCTIHLPDYGWWYKPWKLFTWFINPCRPTRFVQKEKRLLR
jgi:dihydroorotate dehydrogenase (NAD+) catalytic subunit